MRLIGSIAAIALAIIPGVAVAAPATQVAPSAASAPASAAAVAKYTTATSQLSSLIADPAAKAVLAKNVPQLVAKEDILERAGGMTLKEIQESVKAYAPDMLSDAVLAKIDLDLAQIK